MPLPYVFEDRTPPLLSRLLLVRDRDQFFECRKAVADLDQARLAQVTDAFALGLLGDVHRAARGEDDLLDFFGDRHNLVNPDAALVTVVAHRTADGPEGLPVAIEVLGLEAGLEHRLARIVGRDLAVLAQLSRQALRRD